MKYILLLTLLYPITLLSQENPHDPMVWKQQGDKEYGIFTEEYEKNLIGLEYDQDKMYNALLEAYYAYGKADIFAQILEDNDMGINTYLGHISERLHVMRPYFVNAGMYYFENKEYLKASEYFELYWDYNSLRIFSDNRVEPLEQGEHEVTIKYFAVVCAIHADDNNLAISLLERLISEPYIPNETYKESDLYEFLTDEYRKADDRDAYMNSLHKGRSMFPKNVYFLVTIINEYIASNDYENAITFLDKAIKTNPNAFAYVLAKANLLVYQQNYTSARKGYLKVLKKDRESLQALEGLGVLYALQAQTMIEQQQTYNSKASKKKQKKLDKKTIDLYKKSLVYMEKHYKLAKKMGTSTDKQDSLLKLQNIYYNLTLLGVNKDKELTEIEKELKNLH